VRYGKSGFRARRTTPRDVWGYLAVGATRTVDAHACRLRKKLSASSRPFVVNVRGVGYKLTEDL
jgi:DNA-binding response OmpR family regulator